MTIQTDKQPVKVAILDLYNGIDNEGMRGFREILERYKVKNNLNLSYQLFDVRKKVEVPGTDFDIYISSGGPGSPIDSEGTEWEKKYFNLIDKLEDHNLSATSQKKHGFFVCHSFQLMCRKYKLGDINMRKSASFGVLPVNQTHIGKHEPVFEGLADPFYAVDSRLWQVIHPNEKRFMDLGMQLLAIEKERPYIDLPRAMMAIRFSDYFFSTQFHPEADASGVKSMLLRDEKKQEVVSEHGLDKYNEMLERLEDPDKITHTQNTMIPNFLDQAVLSLQDA
ncbi:type 1 glutamine amidotransferase [Mucilaginibacter sp.]|uniref:type 1 glutamine amidotransferase n=1 Tax=Mucilaginibacter sp. TaxID=1882438 RepID=UPI003D0DD5FB